MALDPLTFLCAVLSVHDGDSLRCRGMRDRVRFEMHAAPDFEDSPPCRQRPQRKGYVCSDRLAVISRDALRAMIADRTITCVTLGSRYRKDPYKRDRYRRILARCSVDGRDVSQAMIAGGWAERWR